MGVIRQTAISHFDQYPEEKNLVSAFLPLFYVTWAKRIKRFNTNLSFYLLNPEEETKKYFGFLHEILLVYAPFSQLQDRTMKAVEQIFLEDPARGRVETFSWIIITQKEDSEDWFSDYCASNGITKTIIPLYETEVIENRENKRYIKDILTKYLFVKDWFDKALPLKTDETFFGRVNLINEIRQGIRAGENIGLFGLRKTGKTSIIYRIKEMFSNENVVLIYDCRQPRYRNKHWLDLLKIIIDDIISESDFRGTIRKGVTRNDEIFFDLLKKYNKKKPILVIFDEFEFISNIAKSDPHWQTEFLDLWQTLQAAQNETNKISFMIAGVNPYSVEEFAINGEQNPLFNIFRIYYVTGFDEKNIRNMVQILGHRMGLNFADDFCRKLYVLFGGHPLLCRLACSVVHKKLINDARPCDVTENILNDSSLMDEINYKISSYCKDILSPLREFYDCEYDMLTYLAIGDVVSFMELAKDPLLTEHLKRYGILKHVGSEKPYISIDALRLIIARDYSLQHGQPVLNYVVPQDKRSAWLSERQNQISWHLKRIRMLSAEKNMPVLPIATELSDALRFSKISVVKTKEDFEIFINSMNICFVEPIESYGKTNGKKAYFWNEVKDYYKYLFQALLRIKAYRHASHHEKLDPKFIKIYDGFLKEDFSDRDFNCIPDGYFLCQQIVLDHLVEAFMIEINGLE